MANDRMIDEGYIRAQQWFAAANGWRRAVHGFSLAVLARNGVHDRAWCCDPVDHPEYYRKDRRAAAIVGHHYDGYGTENITELAARFGLVVHVAPLKAMSWYYPDSTTLLVITRPGTLIVWPTDEQMAATEQAHADYMVRSRERWDARQEARRRAAP